MGVMAVGGAILGRRAENDKAMRDAKSFGIHQAQVEFSGQRERFMITKQLAAVQDERLNQHIMIQAAQARAEAEAKVSAGQAGVSGQSVDAVVNDTERSAAEAEGALDKQVRAQQLQFGTDYIDSKINTHLNVGRMETRSKSSKQVGAEYLLSFGQGFVSGGGFGD